MKFISLFVTLLTVAFITGSCTKNGEPATSLSGTWQLTGREGYRAPTPSGSPNEAVTFTGAEFYFYKDNRQTGYGTYAFVSGSTCGNPASTPVLRFTYADVSNTLADAVATVTGNTLVLDYGIACDAPRETYVRVP
ncbi:hypothetical protein [Hymenobacter sp. IS2118]|uniref:hypothetical protein n=1 Tax=Hymenobacter sp. IS2118 TaxID=1505605 RepID=UPI0005534EB0|nr:hypothetical protein [Hymenobacter sp. IS2118]